MTTNDQPRRKSPPYASATAIDHLFERMLPLKDPGLIDPEWIRTYEIDSQDTALPTMLQWLGVVDSDHRSTGIWDSLRVAADRAAALRPLVESAYSDVFEALDVHQATKQELAATFIRVYGVGTTQRYVRCFLSLCEHAGIATAAQRKAAPQPSQPKPPTLTKPNVKMPSTRKREPATPSAPAVSLHLDVEIPAEWSAEQVASRFAQIREALKDSGLSDA